MSLLTLLVALALGLFGAGTSSGVEESAPATARPTGPPPSLPGRVGPPPAWVETEHGSFWLAYSGFCWKALCVDMSAFPDDLPPVVVRKGEVVRFHLGFRPRRVELAVGRRADLRLRLEPARTVSWRVERAGVVSLLAYSARGGSAGYLAVLKLR